MKDSTPPKYCISINGIPNRDRYLQRFYEHEFVMVARGSHDHPTGGIAVFDTLERVVREAEAIKRRHPSIDMAIRECVEHGEQFYNAMRHYFGPLKIGAVVKSI